MSIEKRRIAVLGAGSWGTALASHLAHNGHQVTLWGRAQDVLADIDQHRENRKYLPGIILAESLSATVSLDDALAHAADVLIVVPSHSFAEALNKIAACGKQSPGIIWACKGIDVDSGRFLSDLLVDRQGSDGNYAVISGPTFAAEVASGLPTAITVASTSSSYADAVGGWFQSERFRAYTTLDVSGVQLGGALKNVYAIAAGISDGLKFGANARVALITRGLAELRRLGVVLGADPETLSGLSGTGDLVLTCTDDQSRNRRFGLALADGLSVDEARQLINRSVEGIAATRAAHRLASQHAVEMPIVEQVYAVIENGLSPDVAVKNLLGRAPRTETG